LLLGDSIFEQLALESRIESTKRIEELKSGRKSDDDDGPSDSTEQVKLVQQQQIMTCAVGGDRTEHLLWRLTKGGLLNALQGFNVNRVVILIGHNNLDRDSPQDIIAGIEAILSALRCLGRRLLVTVLPIPPCAPSSSSKYAKKPDILQDKLAATNRMIHSFSSQDHFFHWTKAPPSAHYVDHVHFSDAGNDAFAEALRTIL
jgi:hypothetical protein